MIYGRDRNETPEEVIRDLREIVENLQEDNKRLKAELAKFKECEPVPHGTASRGTACRDYVYAGGVDHVGKIYHKEGE